MYALISTTVVVASLNNKFIPSMCSLLFAILCGFISQFPKYNWSPRWAHVPLPTVFWCDAAVFSEVRRSVGKPRRVCLKSLSSICIFNCGELTCKSRAAIRYSFMLACVDKQKTRTMTTKNFADSIGWNLFHQSGYFQPCIRTHELWIQS